MNVKKSLNGGYNYISCRPGPLKELVHHWGSEYQKLKNVLLSFYNIILMDQGCSNKMYQLIFFKRFHWLYLVHYRVAMIKGGINSLCIVSVRRKNVNNFGHYFTEKVLSHLYIWSIYILFSLSQRNNQCFGFLHIHKEKQTKVINFVHFLK